MRAFNTILIANRGEIARRIIRACRAMGIRSVAVFSDADADAAFVREADVAQRIGGPRATDSYLCIDKILDAAQSHGAQAIHPGYGFLSETAAFAAACASRGVAFIGPPATVLAKIGSKREAKQLAASAGVPTIAGYHGDAQDAATLEREAERIGLPVLLKASAGGGGKGMRVVHSTAQLRDVLDSAKRESRAAFGDDTMLLEAYLERPRHVEVQILADTFGHVVHLFERECSVQRRHQKIIEETPSCAVDAALRQRMGAAAVAVARAAGYVGAGTVEFLLAPDGQFFFLEVNARLQVEHPVTECITGVDLVREQIRIAEGAHLTLQQDALRIDGAAVECRLYAEDPAHNFLPTSGRVIDWMAPQGIDGLRIDTALDGPTDISIYYDPMLAKVIAHAPSRAEALRKLAYALEILVVQGVVTNRTLLIDILRDADFCSGDFDTGFLDKHRALLQGGASATPAQLQQAAIAATLAALQRRQRKARAGGGITATLRPGYRNNALCDQAQSYHCGDAQLRVEYAAQRDASVRLTCGDTTMHTRGVDLTDLADLADLAAAAGWLRYQDERGVVHRWRVASDEGGTKTYVSQAGRSWVLIEEPRFAQLTHEVVPGACVAPMPAAVVKVLAAEGQPVKQGETLLVLEAMKMEHLVRAPSDGVVAELTVREGDHVEADQLLARVEEETGEETGAGRPALAKN